MELSKNYLPSTVEDQWYKYWLEKKYFESTPDSRVPFTIVIPPPNVTGVLHMGHTLNETVQDILIRKARMSGYNACWVPGSDHASIATEAKVVDMLREKNIDKNDLSREEFLKYAFEWKEKYGNIIYNQIAKLGCSVDWNRVTFTMDEHYNKAVIKVFVDLYNKGFIYRGARMINWDPSAKTALSDEEVEHREVQGKLYYIKYFIVDESQKSEIRNQKSEIRNPTSNIQHSTSNYITIATQRPETIMGDTAVCINPNDERYFHLKNKKVIVPLVNREVPVIFDDYVDKDFGTGILKITPAHDINDYNIGLKHNLEIINTLNDDGTLSEAAQIFVGEDRFEARKKIVQQLKAENLLVKEEEYTTRMGFSQRTNAVIEPKISTQWFVKMKPLAKPALKAVMDGDIQIYPSEKYLATYKYWLENVKDWCISRQLWWGQQIPAWYDEEGNVFVAETKQEAFEKLSIENSQLKIENIVQDEDVLDTWFSSWLWPIEVFNGITQPNNKDINYYYPTSVLVTAPEIIFFWVARMIMAGFKFKQEKPFSDIYFTGIVRDKLGRKMSKSLGNSPDLLNLIDKYGADAVRFGILISSPAGNDILFDEASLEQGRNFNNKLWNALKLVKMWEEKISEKKEPNNKNQIINNYQHSTINFPSAWFENRLNEVKIEVENLMKQFHLSEALKTIYSLIWDDFCSWYLEWIKPDFEKSIDEETYNKTIYFFDELLQLLHPFMPFITEEIYHLLKERNDDLCVKQFKSLKKFDKEILQQGKLLKEIITAIRDARNKNQIKPKEKIKLYIQTLSTENYKQIENILSKQLNTDEIIYTSENIENTIVITVEKDKFFIKAEQQIDKIALKEDLEKDLNYQTKFLESVQRKLSNERFIQNAKQEIIALEKKKKADAETRIKTLKESLNNL
ncbi:MAG: valine--tRNA ligase [Chitinophagaceae bacterium]